MAKRIKEPDFAGKFDIFKKKGCKPEGQRLMDTIEWKPDTVNTCGGISQDVAIFKGHTVNHNLLFGNAQLIRYTIDNRWFSDDPVAFEFQLNQLQAGKGVEM